MQSFLFSSHAQETPPPSPRRQEDGGGLPPGVPPTAVRPGLPAAEAGLPGVPEAGAEHTW